MDGGNQATRSNIGTPNGRSMDEKIARVAVVTFLDTQRPEAGRELMGYWSQVGIAVASNSMTGESVARYVAGAFDGSDVATTIMRVRSAIAGSIQVSCVRANMQLADVMPPSDANLEQMADLAHRVQCDRPYPDMMVRILINWRDDMERLSSRALNQRVAERAAKVEQSDPEIRAHLTRIEQKLDALIQESKRAAESGRIDHTRIIEGIKKIIQDMNVNDLVTYRAIMYAAGATVWSARVLARQEGKPFTSEDMADVSFEAHKNFNPGKLLARLAPKVYQRIMKMHKIIEATEGGTKPLPPQQ